MSRGLACPWDEGLTGLDGLSSRLHSIARSDMFGILISYL
jgi:hypothetical protein